MQSEIFDILFITDFLGINFHFQKYCIKILFSLITDFFWCSQGKASASHVLSQALLWRYKTLSFCYPNHCTTWVRYNTLACKHSFKTSPPLATATSPWDCYPSAPLTLLSHNCAHSSSLHLAALWLFPSICFSGMWTLTWETESLSSW